MEAYMQVVFETPLPASAQLRGMVEPRVKSAMRRVAWLVSSVRVELSEAGGRSPAQRWQVELHTARFGTIAIAARSRDAAAGLNRALAGATAALLRAWRREAGTTDRTSSAPSLAH
jgi:hypothetical protein